MSSTIDITAFYKDYFEFTDSNIKKGQLSVPCPFHEDKSPSFSINLETGLWKCFSENCETNANGKKGGNVYQFYQLFSDEEITIEEAYDQVNKKYGLKDDIKRPEPIKDFPITEEQVATACDNLLSRPKILSRVREYGWTKDTIRKFQIGFNPAEKRLWIPIREGGQLVNIRKYSPKNKTKHISVQGFGGARLWPIDNFANDVIYLVEGEKDCILANQCGLPAITVTGGAGTFDSEWIINFQDKSVYICYDIDEAGQKGATKIAGMIFPVVTEVKIIRLPLSSPENADFTDFICQKHTIEEFHDIVSRTPVFKPQEKVEVVIPDDVYNVPLEQTIKHNMFYKRVRTRVRVIGKESADFLGPERLRATCNRDNKTSICMACPVYPLAELEKTITETTPEILEFTGCTHKMKKKLYKDAMGIENCSKNHIEVLETRNVQQVTVINTFDFFQQGDEKYTKAVFYLLRGVVECNTDYEIECIPLPHPKDQSMVYLGYKTQRCRSSVEEFELTDEIKEKLKIFQCVESKQN